MTHDNAAPKNVTKRLRFEIFRRDGFRCRYCGLPAAETGEGLTIDHVIPKALGGTNEPGNLVTACKDCNSGKTSSGPDEAHVAQVTDDALRWADALQQVAEQRQEELHGNDAEVNEFANAWNVATYSASVAPDWRDAIKRFLSLGLTAADLAHFAEVAGNANLTNGGNLREWRYFCGCCWRELDRRQEMAARMLGVDQPQAEPDARVKPEAPGNEEPESYPEWELGFDMHDWVQSEILAASIVLRFAKFADVNAAEVLNGWRDWRPFHEAEFMAPSDFEAAMEATAGGHAPVEAWR